MIRRLHVQNLLSLKDTTIELGPFNIFVGPNASGKSAVFKALHMLSLLVRGAYVRGQHGEFLLSGIPLDRVAWRGDDTLPITYEVWFEDGDHNRPDYTLEIRKVGGAWSVTRELIRITGGEYFDSSQEPFQLETEFRGTITWKPPYPATLSTLIYAYRNDPMAAPRASMFLGLSKRIGATWRYRFSAEDISAAVRPRQDPRTKQFVPPHVEESGRNLAWELQRLQGANRDLFQSIEQILTAWFPHIKSINFDSVVPGDVRLAFSTSRTDRLVPAAAESDGVLHALALLWRAYTATSEDTICLEEPENATHPYFLPKRYEFLRRLALEGVVGHPVRTLVATHSPDFLNCVSRDEALSLNLLRVAQFEGERGSQVYSVRSMPDVAKLFERFKGPLGDLWYTGAISGVPIRPG